MDDDSKLVPVPTLAEVGIRETIDCTKHGVYAWRGDIICMHCGRVYQTTKPHDRYFAPQSDVCACGSALIERALERARELAAARPADAPPIAAAPSARQCCHLCFRKIVKRASGRVPNWAPKIETDAAALAPSEGEGSPPTEAV